MEVLWVNFLNDTVLAGRWDWTQNGEKMGYDVVTTKQTETETDDIIAIAPEQHKVLFENDHIRMLKVTVKPGDKVAMHTNPENINYILQPGTLRLINPDGVTMDLELTEGQVIPTPIGTHAVENIGGTEVQTIGVELKVK